jgi:hypothetical protein
MPGNDVNELLTVQRLAGSALLPNNQLIPARSRGSAYAEKAVIPYGGSMRQLSCDEGSEFVANNPTPGTGVAYALTTAFNDTTGAMFALYNKNPSGGKTIFPDYLKLLLTAAPTATVSMEFVVKTDTKDRTPTAGNTPITPVCTRGDVTDDGGLLLQAFNAAGLTVPASGPNAKQVCRARIPTSLGIVGDEYVLQFGAGDPAGAPIPGLTAARATAVGRFTATAKAFGLPPGQWAVIYMWWLTAATTAPSFEWELGYSAR